MELSSSFICILILLFDGESRRLPVCKEVDCGLMLSATLTLPRRLILDLMRLLSRSDFSWDGVGCTIIVEVLLLRRLVLRDGISSQPPQAPSESVTLSLSCGRKK